jgi:hypothetical protein
MPKNIAAAIMASPVKVPDHCPKMRTKSKI